MAVVKAILLEPVKNLGRAGDVVSVRRGYFLYLERLERVRYATGQALAGLEKEREILRSKDLERKQEAERWVEQLAQKKWVILSEAGEKGVLYGSVSARDIAQAVAREGIPIHPKQVLLPVHLKEVGTYGVTVELHPQVVTEITVVVEPGRPEA